MTVRHIRFGRWGRVGSLLAVGLVGFLVLMLAGHGNVGASRPATGPSPAISAAALNSYVNAAEAVRLPVNQLLEQADPILDGYREHRITPAVAAQQMGALEQRFAAYLVQMTAITPADPALARINAPYAHTYLLEDGYLATLAADLGNGDFGNLPDTQDQQRLAIIEWRVQLQLAAAQVGYLLPADIQQAGRGEIAPSPTGS